MGGNDTSLPSYTITGVHINDTRIKTFKFFYLQSIPEEITNSVTRYHLNTK